MAALPSTQILARRLTHNADKAQDLVQDAIVKALRARDSYTPQSGMAAWLATITRNEHASDRRKAWRQSDGFEDIAPTLRATDDPEANTEARQVWRAIEAQTPDVRQALCCIALGYTIDETAEHLGRNRHTVKQQVQTGRASLRKWAG